MKLNSEVTYDNFFKLLNHYKRKVLDLTDLVEFDTSREKLERGLLIATTYVDLIKQERENSYIMYYLKVMDPLDIIHLEYASFSESDNKLTLLEVNPESELLKRISMSARRMYLYSFIERILRKRSPDLESGFDQIMKVFTEIGISLLDPVANKLMTLKEFDEIVEKQQKERTNDK